MTAVIHVEQARGDGLGASQAAQAIGFCPPSWGAPVDLWCELTGRMQRPPAGQAAVWGQILEPVVRGAYLERNRCEIEVPRASYYHRALPWLRATPDGIRLGAERRLVQVKCPGLRAAPHWGTDERREVPIYYLIQAVVEMAVTDIDRVDFAVLLGGQDYFEVPVHRDEELEHDVLDALRAFWRHVETDIAPPLDGSDGWGRYLSTLYKAQAKKSVDATPELSIAIARWRELRTLQKQIAAEESVIKVRLLAEAVRHGAKRITSEHGTVPIVEAAHTSRGWEHLARDYAKRVGADVDADIEQHTSRKAYAYARAPSGWSTDEGD